MVTRSFASKGPEESTTRVQRNLPIAKVKNLVQDAIITEWGKVRRIDSDAGDTMRSSSLGIQAQDSRDATFIRVRASVSILYFSLLIALNELV